VDIKLKVFTAHLWQDATLFVFIADISTALPVYVCWKRFLTVKQIFCVYQLQRKRS